jgi:hypothetical protein
MACTAAVLLKDCCRMRCDLLDVIFYEFATRADNYAYVLRVQSINCVENMSEKCAT